jgi:hypothetical protein
MRRKPRRSVTFAHHVGDGVKSALVVPPSCAHNLGMLWWFERDGLYTRVEVLHLANGGCELHIFDASGAAHLEQFKDAADLAKRQQAVHELLIAEGWKRSGEWLL